MHDYETPRQARSGIATYFTFYNEKRLHQPLAYRTPDEIYLTGSPVVVLPNEE